MKFFENKKIWKKIVIMLLLVMFFQFAFITPVKASVEEVGGTLLSPVMSLVVGLGDGIMDVLHDFIMGQSMSGINVDLEPDTPLLERILKIIGAVVVGIATVALIIAVPRIRSSTSYSDKSCCIFYSQYGRNSTYSKRNSFICCICNLK